MSNKSSKQQNGKQKNKSLAHFFGFKKNKRSEEKNNNLGNEERINKSKIVEPNNLKEKENKENANEYVYQVSTPNQRKQDKGKLNGSVIKPKENIQEESNIDRKGSFERASDDPKSDAGKDDSLKENKDDSVVNGFVRNKNSIKLNGHAFLNNLKTIEETPRRITIEQLKEDAKSIQNIDLNKLQQRKISANRHSPCQERPKLRHCPQSLPSFNMINHNTKTIVLSSKFATSPTAERKNLLNRCRSFDRRAILDNKQNKGQWKVDSSRKYSLPQWNSHATSPQQRKYSTEINTKNIKKKSPIVLQQFHDHSALIKQKIKGPNDEKDTQMFVLGDEDEDDDGDEDEDDDDDDDENETDVNCKNYCNCRKGGQSERECVCKSPESNSSSIDSNKANSKNTKTNFHNKTKNDLNPKDLEILVTLGTGSFGRVFLVEDRSNSVDEVYAMKIMKIKDIIKLNQVEHVNSERKILQITDHPFVVQCYWTCRDEKCLYMLFEYVVGGELFTYVRNKGKFSSDDTKFYLCEIICVLGYLHKNNIAYRDLKPENLLLDNEGHLKFTDFGFAKVVEDKTWTLCGTPEYLSPEAIQGKGHNSSCDWWALGILTYEMLVGEAPFVDDNQFGLYQKILAAKIQWPSVLINTIQQDFIKQLVVERSERLGQRKGQEGTNEVRNHQWFDGVNWDDVEKKQLKPPIVPRVAFKSDTSNFDDFDETFELNTTPNASIVDQKLFEEWQFES